MLKIKRSVVILFFFLMLCAVNTSAQSTTSDAKAFEHSPKIKRSIEKALKYLASHQSKNGSWSNSNFGTGYTMAMTSVSGLALLSTGNTSERGPYSKHLKKALSFVLSKTKSRSFKSSGLITTANEGQPMYGHGFAVLFLAQIYGTSSHPDINKDIRSAIRRGVQLIARSQSKEGGWYYSPDSNTDEGSVTIHQIQALRAAQNVGVTVKKSVIDKALKYLADCQNSDGGIRYSVSYKGPSTVALSAAGLACYFNCGVYDNKPVRRLTKYLKSKMYPNNRISLTGVRSWHGMYMQHYASQAIFFQGGIFWQDYFKEVSQHLVSRQQPDGSWKESPGAAYSTPIGIMILSLPYRYLPINQR